MSYTNMHFEFARNAGRTWLQEQLAKADDFVPLTLMVHTVEQYILIHTGRVVHIVVENDKQLQMLGRAYDYIKKFTKL